MSSSQTRSLFVTGLRNAHAMENQALSVMQLQARRIAHYPDVARRLDQHIRETEEQMRRLETILRQFGADRSGFKDIALSMVGSMAAIGHSIAGDEILKNYFADFAFEHYEIAAYRSLITIAEAAGYEAALPPLKQSLHEEESMAEWLEGNLRSITLRYASLKEIGENPKI